MHIKNHISTIINEITARSEQDLDRWAISCQGENHTRQRAARDISNTMALLRDSRNINNIKLDLSFLNLSTLPPKSVWLQLQGVRHLNLSYNRLTTAELKKAEVLTSLRAIEIDHNSELRIIPCSLIQAQKELNILSSSHSNIQYYPESITQCKYLYTVDLSHNNIHDLPQNIGSEQLYLNKLNLSYNSITELPESIGFLPFLSNLELTGNPLRINSDIFTPDNSTVLINWP